MDNKFFKISTILLLVLNLAIISFIVLRPKLEMHKRSGASEMLKLDSEQSVIFRELGRNHRDSNRLLLKKQKEKLESYFNTKDEVEKLEIIATIEELEKQKVILLEEHFNELETLLKEDQKSMFPQFIKNVLEMNSGGRKGEKKK